MSVNRRSSQTSSLKNNWNYISSGPYDVIKVEVQTLDKLLDNRNVDLLKIDAEGSGLNVLRGATKSIANTDSVVIEPDEDDYTEIIKLLLDNGFVVLNNSKDNLIFRKADV